eukprot:2371488-Prymnesium_polylepis.1
MIRITLSINGRDKGVLVKISEDSSKLQLVQRAAEELLPADTDIDPSKAKLYVDCDEIKDASVLDKGDRVYVAFNGSPHKDKIARTEPLLLSTDASALSDMLPPRVEQPAAVSLAVASTPAASPFGAPASAVEPPPALSPPPPPPESEPPPHQ